MGKTISTFSMVFFLALYCTTAPGQVVPGYAEAGFMENEICANQMHTKEALYGLL